MTDGKPKAKPSPKSPCSVIGGLNHPQILGSYRCILVDWVSNLKFYWCFNQIMIKSKDLAHFDVYGASGALALSLQYRNPRKPPRSASSLRLRSSKDLVNGLGPGGDDYTTWGGTPKQNEPLQLWVEFQDVPIPKQTLVGGLSDLSDLRWNWDLSWLDQCLAGGRINSRGPYRRDDHWLPTVWAVYHLHTVKHQYF